MNWLDRVEKAANPAAGGKVSRAGKELRVELIGGRTVEFPDSEREVYRYAGYVGALCSHIINRLGGEGSGVFLVVHDSTGDTTAKLHAAPVVSPDGTRFAVTSMSGEADYDANVVEIWRIAEGKPEKEFSIEPEGYQPSDAVWRDAQTLDFTKNVDVGPFPGVSFKKTPARVRHTPDGWVVGP